MNKKLLILLPLAMTTVFVGCKKEDDKEEEMPNPAVETQSFTVTVENVSDPNAHFATGVFNTPVGASAPGGAGPGNAYEFTVQAGPGSKLSFATMYVNSNDLFYAPEGAGIDLYNGNSVATGDVTSEVYLWDAGTEVNEMPGTGANQPMNQTGPNTGPAEGGTLRKIDAVNDGFTYPDVSNTISVTLAQGSGPHDIVVRIENLAGSTTPIAPGVWVVHTADNPLFTETHPDHGSGLEALAEDGDPSTFAAYLQGKTGLVSPYAPGVYAIHTGGMPLFSDGDVSTVGLESLAEDGDPSTLHTSVMDANMVTMSGVFNTPVGAAAPAPIFPGEKYEFTFTANKGDYLSLATMLVQSNDIFAGFADNGLALWSGNSPISGDVTDQLIFWDAGTEVNQFPGLGVDQAPRQAGVNTGDDENGSVMMVNDGFMYPMVDQSIKVTLTLN